jgi:hypothetical protein
MVGCGAKTSRQYTLRVNLKDQSETALCSRKVEEGKAAAAGTQLPAATCEAFAGQPLSTPATLTIKLENPAVDHKYDLRIDQFSREASAADVKKTFEEAARRMGAIAGMLAKDTDAEKLVTKAAAAVLDRVPDLAAAVVAKARPDGADVPRTPLRAEPRSLTRPLYYDAATRKLRSAAQSRATWTVLHPLSDTHAPATPIPPPRDRAFDDADLAYLATQGVTVDQVADFTVDWCSASSFQRPDLAAQDAMLVAGTPDVAAASSGLAITGKDVAAILVARTPATLIGDRLEALRKEGESWTTASPAAQAFYLMRLGRTVSANLAACRGNVAFLAAKASPATQAKLTAASAELASLEVGARAYADAFDKVFGPVLREGLVLTEQIIQLQPGEASSTVTLEPGRLQLGVGEIDGTGKRTEVASYKLKVRGIEHFALLVGPALTGCTWGCFDKVDMIAKQPTAEGGAVTSVIEKSTSKKYDFSFVTALHVTLVSRDDLGLGVVLGYPLGSASGTSWNVLVGLGLRYASGFELAAGIHGFSTRVLKSAYDDGKPLVLGQAGNESLTVDGVTEDRPQLGAFVMFGFAPDIFSSIER